MEENKFKNIGCSECGKCKKEKIGYTVKYEDGKKYFRCGGFQLIDIYTVSKNLVYEAVQMMEIKHKMLLEELT